MRNEPQELVLDTIGSLQVRPCGFEGSFDPPPLFDLAARRNDAGFEVAAILAHAIQHDSGADNEPAEERQANRFFPGDGQVIGTAGESKYSRVADPTTPVKIAGPVPANHAAITVANMKSAKGAVVSHSGAMMTRKRSAASVIRIARRYRWAVDRMGSRTRIGSVA